LFERNDFNPRPILYNYGLGNPAIKELTTFAKNTDNSKLYLRTKLAIDDFLDVNAQDNLPFYFYEGSNPNAACGLAINMVYAEPLWVGNEQLSVFSMASKPQYQAREQYKTLIYQNMYSRAKHPMLHNATGAKHPMQETPFPGPLTHLPFLFMPEEGKILGNLNETFFAVWRDRPKDGIFIDPEVPPAVSKLKTANRPVQVFENRMAPVQTERHRPDHLHSAVHHDRQQGGAARGQDCGVGPRLPASKLHLPEWHAAYCCCSHEVQ
jgi:hypothetical protein